MYVYECVRVHTSVYARIHLCISHYDVIIVYIDVKINRSFYVNIVYITLNRYINHDKVRVCIDIIKLELIFNLITTVLLLRHFYLII